MFSGITVVTSLILVAVIFYFIGFRSGYKDCEEHTKKNLFPYKNFFDK
jgi:hypothetical protein